ncbi:MAG TPA: NAD(P)-binding domain-containing protein [Actinomycetota bacterium]|nr:NAD(P)-binding domain-containing protein [Actinomycetota bacterium]
MDVAEGVDRYETVIIGAGQAGLATGYHLKRLGMPFVILDAQERVGDAWRTRWDSLRLFTPAWVDGLPGMPFPAPRWSFPTKDQMADYFESYVARFDLPVRTGVTIDHLTRTGDRYALSQGERGIEADRVIVATGANRVPKVPAYASALDPWILQMHSAEYRNPSQLRDGRVLVVGAGNSGAEISYELAPTHPIWLAGTPTGQIPAPLGTRRYRVGFHVFRFFGTRVVTRGNPIGRRLLPKLERQAAPLVPVRLDDLAAANVELVPRVAGVRDGLPLLEDEQVLEVENVIWCTGFRQDFPWIDLPIFDAEGRPMHERGVLPSDPGLYFVGLNGQYSLASEVLPGLGRDVGYIAEVIAREMAAGPATKTAPSAA